MIIMMVDIYRHGNNAYIFIIMIPSLTSTAFDHDSIARRYAAVAEWLVPVSSTPDSSTLDWSTSQLLGYAHCTVAMRPL